MDLSEVLGISAAILGTLGGGAGIIFGMSNWLGKVWANRLMEKEKAQYSKELESIKSSLLKDSESYKIKLKKSEFIFEKQYEASSELVALVRQFLPPLLHQEMDWHEACDEIAHNFKSIIASLENFLSKHGAILDETPKQLLSNAIGLASHHQFDISGAEVPDTANSAANDIYNKLISAEKYLTKQVLNQTST
ncbi:hypothetical protein [Photobacterium sp. 1_MG-2023]|uniref:hypothetical protein n=1 Tax=Photobacterium sp. 1_MG-2023 TaxID=3062646 RepID=UPI0026E47A5E|nr:hypothetical protein [Photobacterium sp. 1_MG-2023]MDO6707593.1 hypothetical protein [Photobacterium sp. 1_MG-2023]